MAVSRDTLIRKYTQAIKEGNTGIFAGAGLSRASGYVDWKNLLRPLVFSVFSATFRENTEKCHRGDSQTTGRAGG